MRYQSVISPVHAYLPSPRLIGKCDSYEATNVKSSTLNMFSGLKKRHFGRNDEFIRYLKEGELQLDFLVTSPTEMFS